MYEVNNSRIGLSSLDTLMSAAFEFAPPNGIIIVDETGNILQLNVQIEFFYGYARDELMGQPIENLLPDRFRKGHRPCF